MRQFLVTYQRSSGTVHFEDLGVDRGEAMRRRFAEEKLHKDDPDIEVVILGAVNLDALKRTHSRYFLSVHELAAATSAALKATASVES